MARCSLHRVVVQAIALLLTVSAAPVHAGTDPDREWFTLETEHFAIHGYDGGLAFAQRVAAHAEDAYATLNPLLGWTPRERVHIRVVDDVDSSNGFAGVSPYDNITLLAFPPSMGSDLGGHGDWLRMLIFHEYSHIVHLDNAEGVPGFMNLIFGKVIKPNEALPRWFTEGLATWVETATTAGGRVGSSRYEMVLRTAALANDLPTIDAITGPPIRVPRSTSWYIYGSTLMDHIIRHAGREASEGAPSEGAEALGGRHEPGEEAVRGYITAYGRRLIPYAMNILSRQYTGKDLVAWWDSMVDEVRARASRTRARIEAAGRLEGKKRTASGEFKYHPRFTADGQKLLYVRADGHSESRLVMAPLDTLDEPTTVAICDGGCGRFDLSRDGRHIYLSTTRPYRRVNSYRDIIRLPLVADNPRGTGRRLTTGARSGDPSLSADGRALWTVSAHWGETSLRAIDPATGDEIARWVPPEHAVLDRPLAHPDGRRLFASMHHASNRDLIEVTLSDGTWRRLSHGSSMEIDPTLTRDGRWLVYVSDVTGVHNLYARDVSGEPHAEGRVFQLTNVLTGAFEPCVSPDGKTLAYVGWTIGGEELFTLPFSPTSGQQIAAADDAPPHPAVQVRAPGGVSAPTPYSPLSTMLPRSWYPTIAYDSVGLTTLGLNLGGVDITRRLSATVVADWDATREALSAYATMGLRVGYPDWEFTLGRYVRDQYAHYGDRQQPYLQEVFHGAVGVALAMPDPVTRMSLSAVFAAEVRRGFEHPDITHVPDAREPHVPREGVNTSVRLSWAFDTTRRDPWSISTSRGGRGALSLRFSLPTIGSDRTTYEVSYRLRHYLTMPWLDAHVLSLGVRGGFAGGAEGRSERFYLGGVPRRDLVNDLVSQVHAGAVWLRGFPEHALSGTSFHMATTEYRLPILRWRRGVGTLPVFARDLTAAVFSDVALVHEGAFEAGLLQELRTGVGMELRLKSDLLFGFTAHFRLGYAYGFGPEGLHHMYIIMAPDP